jgi:hypothetical protein
MSRAEVVPRPGAASRSAHAGACDGCVVLCTVVWDTYGSDQRRAIWEALKMLLPADSPDWSRKGVYGFWDPETRKLLYLGLATNLPERFAQHNGLVSHGGGNKRSQIDAWFASHTGLGFTVLLQAAAVAMLDGFQELSLTIGTSSDGIIALGEGQLIELHRKETGVRPPWNGVAGASRGRDLAIDTGTSLIPILAAARDSLFVARRSLRDLVADERALAWEATIHAARMRAVMEGHDLPDLSNPSGPDSTRRIEQLLLMRAGHLVDDLSPSDAMVMEWLRRIEDGRADLELRRLRDGLETLAPKVRLEGDREVMQRLRGVFASGGFDEQATHVSEMLTGGYLAHSPRLGGANAPTQR